MLSKLGEKIAGFLGERTDFGTKGSALTPQQIGQFFETNSLADLLPYRSYDSKTQLFENANSLGFVLETPPLVGASEEMQKQVRQIFAQHLEEGSSLQFMLWADPDISQILIRWEGKRSSQSDMLKYTAQQRAQFFQDQVYNSEEGQGTLRTFRCIISYAQTGDLANPVQVKRVQRFQRRLMAALKGVNLSPWVWEDADLVRTVRSWANMTTTPAKQKTKVNPYQSLSEQIPHPSTLFQVEEDHIRANSNFLIRTYHTQSEPDEWSLHAMGELIGGQDERRIPCPFILHYGVTVPKQGSLKTKLFSKASYVENQARTGLGKFVGNLEAEAQELDYTRRQLSQGERLVQTHFSVILLCPESLIEEAEQTLGDTFIRQGWQLAPNRYIHLPVFLQALPMMWGEGVHKDLNFLKRLKTTLSTESANLVPLQGEWCGTKTPGLLLAGRQGQVFTWSPFDNQGGNYNCCVVGRSGSGKSVFMQEMMTATLGLGGRVFVLDVGRSFEKTCRLLSGQFLEFSANTEISLNPFSTLPQSDSKADQEARSDAFAMLRPVIGMMAAPTKGTDDMENALIEQALQATWQSHKETMTMTHVAQWLKDQKNPKAQDLGTMLYPYTDQGAHGKYFSKPSTVNFTNPLFLLELEELKEKKDLQGVVVQMMIIQITNQMFLGDRQTPFHIVFDEAWDMLRGPQTGVFIETLARRLRKYYGSLIVGTQSVNDFFASPGAQACFDNSDWMCFLSQKAESIAQLKETNRLSADPQKETLLKSIKTIHGKYAEVLIDGSQGYAACRFQLDPFSGLLYSTKAEDYAAVKTLQDQGVPLIDAIKQVGGIE